MSGIEVGLTWWQVALVAAAGVAASKWTEWMDWFEARKVRRYFRRHSGVSLSNSPSFGEHAVMASMPSVTGGTSNEVFCPRCWFGERKIHAVSYGTGRIECSICGWHNRNWVAEHLEQE